MAHPPVDINWPLLIFGICLRLLIVVVVWGSIAIAVLFVLGILLQPFLHPILTTIFLFRLFTYPIVLLARRLGISPKYIRHRWVYPRQQAYAHDGAQGDTHHQEYRAENGGSGASSSNSRQEEQSSSQSDSSQKSNGADRPNATENPFDPYEILGVSKGASKDDIKRAYRRKIMMNHPDKLSELDPELQRIATARTAELNKAYELLGGK